MIDRPAGDSSWGPRNNPGAEANIARLIAAWRREGRLIRHVHHASRSSAGSFYKGAPGHKPKPEVMPAPGEPIHMKEVNSAFIGTTLEHDLRAEGVDTLVIVGLTTNHCVSTTVRMAGNLGFTTYVVEDATATFDRAGLDGTVRPRRRRSRGGAQRSLGRIRYDHANRRGSSGARHIRACRLLTRCAEGVARSGWQTRKRDTNKGNRRSRKRLRP